MRHFILSILLISLSLQAASQTFLSEQLKYPRVREARDSKDAALEAEFKEKGLVYPPWQIHLRAFKDEGDLELWLRATEEDEFQLFKTYDIVQKSGVLGPKTRQGDLQVPEGIYYIDRYNPASSYHLSLGINYPNNADKRKNPEGGWGGDIFIHGSDVTIGCLPMTDDIIREIYWLAVQSKNLSIASTEVHIFPYRMNSRNSIYFDMRYLHDEAMRVFWAELQPIYDSFEETRMIPKVVIAKDGRYGLE